MENQTQKTILISLIVSLIVTVPFAIIVTFLTVTYLAPEESDSSLSVVSDAIEQISEINDSSMNETMPPTQEPQSMQVFSEQLVPNRQTSETEAGRLAIARTIFTTDAAAYSLESELIEQNGQGYNLQSIKRVDFATGEESVWVQDLKSLDTSGLLRSNEEFIIFSNPNQGAELYLEVIPGGGTELIGMDVYRFSLTEQTLTRLNVSSQLRNNFGAYEIAANGIDVLLVPPTSQTGLDQDLLLVDLKEDTSRRLFSLQGSETFNAGASGLQVLVNLRWVDTENFVYDVYDQSLKPSNPDLSSEGITKLLIEERSYSLSVK